MKEAYVSYEVAKLLKEKGFYWDCEHYYKPNGEIVRTFHTDGSRHINSSVLYKNQCLAPTQQMACRWLREEKNLNIDVSWDNVLNWFFQVVSLTETVQLDYEEPRVFHSSNETVFKTYEDAVEAALEYVLTKLI